MSLWTKPLSEVTFEDVKTFCEQKLPEGTQLDYKREMPNDLAKTIAAFANTSGGLILIGVEEAEDNTPELPIRGFEEAKGASERVTQIARDGIYPSILPEISRPIPVDGDDGRFVLVVRIDQSIAAPHAIKNKTKVYVRTGNVSEQIELADVDRIEQLFKRRSGAVSRREETVTEFLKRSRHLLQPSNTPFFWGGVIPVFPEQPVLTERDCFKLLYRSVRRVAGGAMTVDPTTGNDGERVIADVESLGEYGDYFFCTTLKDFELPESTDILQVWYFDWLVIRFRRLMHQHCCRIRDAVEQGVWRATNGGQLLVVGLEGAHNVRFKRGQAQAYGSAPIDNSLRREAFEDLTNLSSELFERRSDPSQAVKALLDSFSHSLGLEQQFGRWPDY